MPLSGQRLPESHHIYENFRYLKTKSGERGLGRAQEAFGALPGRWGSIRHVIRPESPLPGKSEQDKQ